MTRPLDITILGLSLSSSWGNGHATTFRALIRGLHARGHRVTFLERDVPWYASQRDLADPDFCRLVFYDNPAELETRHRALIAGADAVLIGSYVPDGIEVIRRVMTLAGGPVGFYDIDTPVTLARLDEDQCSWLSRMLIPAFDVYFSFTGGPLLDRLEQDYGARRALPLYCAVDAERYRPAGSRPVYDLSYLGTYSPDRQPGLERLLIEPARRLPDRRFIVAGPQYPDDIDWPANVERVEHVGPADHPAFYAASAFTLSVTRAEMMTTGWSPSVRLFEAGACGTPVISDRQPGLETIFPESDAILIADTTDEVVRMLTTTDAPARARIAAAARAAVLGAHTGRHRADDLIAGLMRTDAARPPLIRAMEGQTMAGQRERTGDDAHSPA